MAEFYNLDEGIACMKCEILARKILPSMPVNDPDLGKGIRYELSRNATAKILEELNPKEFTKKANTNLNLNDLVKADSITAFVASIKRIKPELINLSGRHKASKAIIDVFSYSHIKYPLENVINSLKLRAGETKKNIL